MFEQQQSWLGLQLEAEKRKAQLQANVAREQLRLVQAQIEMASALHTINFV